MVDNIEKIEILFRQFYVAGKSPGDAADMAHLASSILQAILSDPNIIEIDPDAEVPENVLKALDGSFQGGYYIAQQDMLKAGWKKEKK